MELTPEELEALEPGSYTLLDLRSEQEAAYGTIPGSVPANAAALPEGLKLGLLQWGKTGWDKTTGMFRLDASAKYAAYFVAEAAEDEAVFTDFVLKGTVKERE